MKQLQDETLLITLVTASTIGDIRDSKHKKQSNKCRLSKAVRPDPPPRRAQDGANKTTGLMRQDLLYMTFSGQEREAHCIRQDFAIAMKL